MPTSLSNIDETLKEESMPAVYIGTMMEAGNIKWRPKFSTGFLEEGPEDQRLIIEFTGSISSAPWLISTSYGYAIDLDAIAITAPILFGKKWLKNKGITKVIITNVDGNRYVIDMQL